MTATTQPGPRNTQSSTAAVGIALFGAAVAMASTFAIAKLLLSSESAALAGRFFAFTAAVSILGTVSCFGTMTGLVFFMPKALGIAADDENADRVPNPRGLIFTALRPVLMISGLAAVGVFLLASPIANILTTTQDSQLYLTEALRVLAITIPAWALTLSFLGATRGLGSMTPTVVINQMFRPIAQIVLIAPIVLASGTPKAWHLAAAWGAPVVVSAIMAAVWVARLGGFSGSGPSPVSSPEFWTYARRHGLSTSLQIALERIDVLIIIALISDEASGIYGGLSRFATAGNFVIFSVAQAVSPHLRRRISAGDLEAARELFRNAASWMVMVAWPLLLLLVFKHRALASLIDQELLQESTILVILGLGIMVSAAAGPVELGLLMLGRANTNLATTAASFATDIILLLILAPLIGVKGAAIAWALAVVVKNGSAGFLANRYGQLRGPARPSLVAAAGAILAVVPISLVTGDSFQSLLIVGAVAGPILLGWIYIQKDALGLSDGLRG